MCIKVSKVLPNPAPCSFKRCRIILLDLRGRAPALWFTPSIRHKLWRPDITPTAVCARTPYQGNSNPIPMTSTLKWNLSLCGTSASRLVSIRQTLPIKLLWSNTRSRTMLFLVSRHLMHQQITVNIRLQSKLAIYSIYLVLI